MRRGLVLQAANFENLYAERLQPGQGPGPFGRRDEAIQHGLALGRAGRDPVGQRPAGPVDPGKSAVPPRHVPRRYVRRRYVPRRSH